MTVVGYGATTSANAEFGYCALWGAQGDGGATAAASGSSALLGAQAGVKTVT